VAFASGYAPANSDRAGYAGFIGSSLIFIAILSMVWGGLDRTTDFRAWAVLSFELFGGLLFSSLFGFSLLRRADFSKHANIQAETQGVLFGVFAGSAVVILEMVILTSSQLASTAQGVWLSMLAPVAETMFADVAVYHLLRSAFPKMRWIWIALGSDAVFSLFHFFHYSASPDWLWILLILIVGNTFFVWTYHLTRNATAPMMAHLIVNVAPNSQNVFAFVLQYGPLLILMFVVFFIVFKCFGGRHR